MDLSVRERQLDLERYDARYAPKHYTGWRICDHPERHRLAGVDPQRNWVCRMCGFIGQNDVDLV